MQDRSWVEIDLKKLENNLKTYRKHQTGNYITMAVVKADAYGHGDIEISHALSNLGVNYFAVSNIDEAINLRKSGIQGEVLILGYTSIKRVRELEEYNITQTLLSEDYANLIADTGYNVKCQFAIDTGMNRIGLDANDIEKCEQTIRYYSKKIVINGIFTHLCVADTLTENEFTSNQIKKFETLVSRLSDLHLPYCHCLNSAGGLWHHSDFSFCVRLGIILYGLKPDYANILPADIKPVLSWKSVVSMIKDVPAGSTIGYGRSYHVSRQTTVATIPTGYADGYSRMLSNKGWVLINGYRAPIVGRICMDQFMVDITGIPNIQIGTIVTLIGENGNEVITADDLAAITGTIGYEITCGISKRVDRMYIK